MWPCQLSFGWCGGEGCGLAVGPLLTCVKKRTPEQQPVPGQHQTCPGQECGLPSVSRPLVKDTGVWVRGLLGIDFQLRHWLSHSLPGSWTCLSVRRYPWPELHYPGLPQPLLHLTPAPLWTWLFRSLKTAHASTFWNLSISDLLSAV